MDILLGSLVDLQEVSGKPSMEITSFCDINPFSPMVQAMDEISLRFCI